MTLITEKKVTPVMQNYLSLKKDYNDYLLFYRLGDFYELFFDDAIKAAKVLNIVLTKRGYYDGKEIPMCGVPAHSSESYLHKLISLGFKVVICDQLETAEEAKKRGHKSVIRRDVVRIVTPGTIIEDTLLEDKSSNYLACIVYDKKKYSIAWVDISTGEFFYSSTNSDNLSSDLLRISPKELLISDRMLDYNEEIKSILKDYKLSLTEHAESFFECSKANKTLLEFYNLQSLKALGNFTELEIAACGSVLEYVKITQKGRLPRLEYPKAFKQQRFMLIDTSARKNLELFTTQFGEKEGSLLKAIDHTVTASGGRLLKQTLSSPFISPEVINTKLKAVEFFVKNNTTCKQIREILKNIPDIERILSRLLLGRGSPKDMYLLSLSFDKIKKLSKTLSSINEHEIKLICKNLGKHEALFNVLDEALIANNIGNARDGGFIKPKYNSELDKLLYIQNNANQLLDKLRDSYRNLTKIGTLKISYNNIIGYYVEVSANHKIDQDIFIHRQSLANCLRYTTTELKELENKIITAREEAINLEIKIFGQLCARIAEESQQIALTAHVIAELDLTTAFAELAMQNNYVKPIIDDSYAFDIVKGRHPVIGVNNKFVANNINLAGQQRIYLVTGPNMAGKSTFLRQNALIAILAQMGSFVPAEYAHIGIIDKIFSRVGASDNITVGYSTFMVEMIETASIINQATERSLVILDEIGRGTGIHDGLSIAQAVIEHLHNINKCRAIFATHYHELSKVSAYLNNLKCFYVKVKEWDGKIIFLHEISEGVADESYGIHVAKLAGFPDSILKRANEIMKELTS
ncbi:MAG: DNA mismatch repair protein MutS [Candidatus Mesenet longicola]|uniref:DNA mismatch repair protein MutS n=1 Tax=Candidatus Mesenet longicola TaxID=1892558 RepID=A0A8J3HVH5_9RICK|nr:MAG: DNA mismatch repair protein MutS [Candidatus Mesenet longicola]GHM59066.1 MAG: DNA mismatch repair protein MutS [Candidatus Mesenet longicola]